MARPIHPRKEIEEALRYAEEHGWRVEQGGIHAWGRIYCPYNDPECRCGEFCITSIWSTPRNASRPKRGQIYFSDLFLRHCEERSDAAVHPPLNRHGPSPLAMTASNESRAKPRPSRPPPAAEATPARIPSRAPRRRGASGAEIDPVVPPVGGEPPRRHGATADPSPRGWPPTSGLAPTSAFACLMMSGNR